MLERWGKPFFTIPASPFAQFGINGLYVLNLLCTLGAGWFCYLIARKMATRLPWMAAVFFLFQPIVFGNVISGLTEPLNALFLAWIFYCFVSQRAYLGAILTSLLPFFRSEGFIILVAVIIYLLARRKWKQLPFVFSGSLLYTLIMGLYNGDWAAIFNQDPYIKHEMHGKFDPGHGNFWHYVNAYKEIWGLVIGALMVLAFLYLAAHIVYLLRRRTPEERSRFAFWLLAPVFLSFFLAHSWVWYTGTMGSHGLLRVFVVVAPCAALLAHYALDRILSFDIKQVARVLPIVIVIVTIYLAYKGNHFRLPFHKEPTIAAYPAEPNIYRAIDSIEKNPQLRNKVIVHQLPFINAQMGWDPWEKLERTKTLYLWSLNEAPKIDWLPDSSIIIWDGWHAVRDAPMPLKTMQSLENYQQIAYYPASDSIYDVRVFLKAKKK